MIVIANGYNIIFAFYYFFEIRMRSIFFFHCTNLVQFFVCRTPGTVSPSHRLVIIIAFLIAGSLSRGIHFVRTT